MKVIFLDVDGVLVHTKTVGNKRRETGWRRYEGQIDVDCLRRLLEIVDATGAKICVISTWRRFDHHMTALERAVARIKKRRFARDLFIESTPFFPDKRRIDEITSWLSERNDVEAFVIIDDEDHGVRGQVRPSYFHGGLQDKHRDEAICVLEGGAWLTPTEWKPPAWL